MEKVLVCLLASTRGHQLTFPAFKRRVLDELDADLAVALLVDDRYDYGNPFWQHARYRWTSPVREDYGEAYDLAQRWLCQERNLAPPDWRVLLAVRGIWLGGIHAPSPQRSASSILPFCRWLLLNNLRADGLLERYDRFVVTRSDFLWTAPHPPLSILDRDAIWVPDGEEYGGVNDRHLVVSRDDVASCLDMLEDVVLDPARLLEEMKHHGDWNDEQFLWHHLGRKGLRGKVRKFPYVMYSARPVDDESPTWSRGRYEGAVGHYVKYPCEYAAATAYATVLRSRADWERRDWTRFDPATAVSAPAPVTRRLRFELERLWFRLVSGLRRPRRLVRLAQTCRRALGRPAERPSGDPA